MEVDSSLRSHTTSPSCCTTISTCWLRAVTASFAKWSPLAPGHASRALRFSASCARRRRSCRAKYVRESAHCAIQHANICLKGYPETRSEAVDVNQRGKWGNQKKASTLASRVCDRVGHGTELAFFRRFAHNNRTKPQLTMEQRTQIERLFPVSSAAWFLQ